MSAKAGEDGNLRNAKGATRLPPDLSWKQVSADDAPSNPYDMDYSPAATTIAFDPVLPLVRVPVAAGPGDAPEKGAYLLAFPDEASWRQAWSANVERMIGLCEERGRMSCSLKAFRECRKRSPWWKAPFEKGPRRAEAPASVAEREAEAAEQEACEQRAMARCMAKVTIKCSRSAESFYTGIFSDLLIARDPEAIPPKFRLPSPRWSAAAQRPRPPLLPPPLPSSPHFENPLSATPSNPPSSDASEPHAMSPKSLEQGLPRRAPPSHPPGPIPSAIDDTTGQGESASNVYKAKWALANGSLQRKNAAFGNNVHNKGSGKGFGEACGVRFGVQERGVRRPKECTDAPIGFEGGLVYPRKREPPPSPTPHFTFPSFPPPSLPSNTLSASSTDASSSSSSSSGSTNSVPSFPLSFSEFADPNNNAESNGGSPKDPTILLRKIWRKARSLSPPW
eukprot:TRINITY_DN2789_c0_g1_i1.p1 TRINITY_DN2789_c0_g1~~TRINITY_DN2789_c0_g1_i1.p1  ORF type:complete len:450 (+),score=77.34 TRINITY_DN2789_c0_g1_i1:251-1600(+)